MLSQSVLARRVFNRSVYDKHSKEFMLARTRGFLSRDRDAIDVGAAVGMYSYFFSQYARHVYSFEAVPEVFKQLQKIERITPINKAVGQECGQTTFYVDDKRLSNSGLQDLVGGYPIDVEVVNLDTHFKDVDLNLGFLKVDTEGTELDVLQGALGLVTKFKPSCMVEIYPKYDKYDSIGTFEFFFNLGYRSFYNNNRNEYKLVEVFSPEEGEQVAKDEKLQKIHDSDFLFVVD